MPLLLEKISFIELIVSQIPCCGLLVRIFSEYSSPGAVYWLSLLSSHSWEK